VPGTIDHGKILQGLGMEFDPRGNMRCDPDYSASAKGVFAAGDANTGAPLVARGHGHPQARRF